MGKRKPRSSNRGTDSNIYTDMKEEELVKMAENKGVDDDELLDYMYMYTYRGETTVHSSTDQER